MNVFSLRRDTSEEALQVTEKVIYEKSVSAYVANEESHSPATECFNRPLLRSLLEALFLVRPVVMKMLNYFFSI